MLWLAALLAVVVAGLKVALQGAECDAPCRLHAMHLPQVTTKV